MNVELVIEKEDIAICVAAEWTSSKGNVQNRFVIAIAQTLKIYKSNKMLLNNRLLYYFSSIPLRSGSYTQPIFINESSKKENFTET